MIRFGAVFAGLLVGCAIYLALVFLVLVPFQRASGQPAETYLGIGFMLIMPFALFVGGATTGFLVGDLSESGSLAPVLLCPGLYLFLIGLPFLPGNGYRFQQAMILAGIAWIAASTVGVLLGARLKTGRSFDA